MKIKVDKLDKLSPVSVDLSKVSDVVKNGVVIKIDIILRSKILKIK